jgi:hypothetical protein
LLKMVGSFFVSSKYWLVTILRNSIQAATKPQQVAP